MSNTRSNIFSDSGRYNYACAGTCDLSDLENPFAEGAFRWVAKGVYTSGPRKGKACILKWFKSGAVFSEDYFNMDIKAVDKALQIVERFNKLGILNKKVIINVPQVVTFCEDSDGDWAGQKSLLEPFIQNYEKFNSNTGWYDDTVPWGEALQALSHFSHHQSGGNYVLCDLQGGYYQNKVVLSDPVILSQCQEFGVTDLGPKGISSFFSQHRCNQFCRSNWRRPADQYEYYRPVQGSAMCKVPTAYSRPRETRYLA